MSKLNNHFSRCKSRATGCWLAAILLLLAGAAGGAERAFAQADGAQACAPCHKGLAEQFELSVHSRLADFELHGRQQGCQACHGSGTRHAKSASSEDIITFNGMEASDVETQCLACHADRAALHWKHSEHAMNGVSCIQCHKIHISRPQSFVEKTHLTEQPLLAASNRTAPPTRASLAKPEPMLCLDCHKTIVSKTMLSSRHPVREGRMNCSSCHAVHGSDMGGLRTSERQNDLCLDCHTSKQGPFAFDHDPVSEDCGICHVPHGSVSNNLLKQNEPFLCLQCHESHFHIGRTGISSPVTLPTGGSQNPFGESGFRRAFGTKCTQCHTQIHGSNMPGQSTTGRGKSLTR